MPPLSDELRGRLEKAVIAARQHAEDGARAALQRLYVDNADSKALPPTFTDARRALRVHLRAHARQLGDRVPGEGPQSIDRLVAECAYEFWHRMLFARFLAENGLLIHPGHGVAMSLEECRELAAEAGIDAWELAARCAAGMLPEIFRPEDPLLQVPFAPEHRQALEKKLEGLPAEVFTAADSLGWVYQFWQVKRNEEVNKSGNKISGDELPAVTQFFTEPYMVQFLLHNTLGAWWVSRQAEKRGCKPSEVTLLGYAFDYLRFREDGTPAAGAFPGWPKTATELKVLDPCCGSGHFLVAAFELLVRIRMCDEGLKACEASEAVLRDNLFGLELDARCTQIAAFNLALAAWKFPDGEGYRLLPKLHIACSGQGLRGRVEDWEAVAQGHRNLRIAMRWLHQLFRRASDLGSLINPSQYELPPGVHLDRLLPLLRQAFQIERAGQDAEQVERGVAAQGIAQAAELLAGRYHLVITNVPFLTRIKQGDVLGEFLDENYPASSTDLATAFLERCLQFAWEGGTIALVTPQNWHFLGSYKRLRKQLLTNRIWNAVVKLGPAAFRGMNWWAANTQLCILANSTPAEKQSFAGLDVSDTRDPNQKAEWLKTRAPKSNNQAEQLLNPDYRIAFEAGTQGKLLREYAYSHHGLTTGDIPRMTRFFWEIDRPDKNWVRFASSVDDTCDYGGRRELLYWCQGKGPIDEIQGARKDGQAAWGNKGILVRQMRHLPVTQYTGDAFDSNNAAIIPNNPAFLGAVWAFCCSKEFHREVRRIDQKVNVTNATLVKVPFDLERWQKEADQLYPNGLPEPHSDDPSQWLFRGDIVSADAPHNLQVAVARLLGYRWPDQPADKLDDLAVKDGILCLSAIGDEQAAADRLRTLLTTAYRADRSVARQESLLAAIGFGGKSLHEWLRDGFFEQHCQLFHNRPFLWHISDGKKDGFSAIVNYHKLDRTGLETLIHHHLGLWLKRQREAVGKNESGAEGRLAAAEELQKKLLAILEGEDPYDIFVRWKPLEKQPIGWEPDLKDGVRLNIRPFVIADVLRKKVPSLHWKKDKGRDPESAPWYPVFRGDRINEHHLSLDEKRAARGKEGTA